VSVDKKLNFKILFRFDSPVDYTELNAFDVKKREILFKNMPDEKFFANIKGIKILLSINGQWKEYVTDRILGATEGGLGFQLAENMENDFTKDLRAARF